MKLADGPGHRHAICRECAAGLTDVGVLSGRAFVEGAAGEWEPGPLHDQFVCYRQALTGVAITSHGERIVPAVRPK